MPGSSTGLSALEDPLSHKVFSDPKDMARVLTEHWGRVLTGRPVNSSLLSKWLRNLSDKLQSTEHLVLTSAHVQDSLRRSHETTPGPDWVPHGAYKVLGDYAASFLYDVAEDMQEYGAENKVPANFNHAILCCLQKTASRTGAVHGDVYAPSKTRPLSIVNTDNRIIANAYRLMMEPIIGMWVSDMQRGFLNGRSMLSNVVDVDVEAMKISLKHPHGAIVLLDFASACPSLSQEYMLKVLSHIGLPEGILKAIQQMYANNLHFVKLKGSIFPSFTSTSGVRQGCPLSPFLFAVIADLLLRRFNDSLPQSLTRAFADDTAVMIPDFHSYAQPIMAIFCEFASISNLHLNIDKTVLIPLWESSEPSIRRWLQDDFPNWAGVEITWAACYLGFFVGPRRTFQTRVTAWSALHLGLEQPHTQDILLVSA